MTLNYKKIFLSAHPHRLIVDDYVDISMNSIVTEACRIKVGNNYGHISLFLYGGISSEYEL